MSRSLTRRAALALILIGLQTAHGANEAGFYEIWKKREATPTKHDEIITLCRKFYDLNPGDPLREAAKSLEAWHLLAAGRDNEAWPIFESQANLSGNAVRYWMQAEKIPMENILVVTDDLALPFGSLRMRGKGSDGGHNGLKHIQEMLGTDGYARLRCGIGSEFRKGQQVDYVLGKWTEEEGKNLEEVIQKSTAACLSFGLIGLARTMNSCNTKS